MSRYIMVRSITRSGRIALPRARRVRLLSVVFNGRRKIRARVPSPPKTRDGFRLYLINGGRAEAIVKFGEDVATFQPLQALQFIAIKGAWIIFP